MKQYLFPAVLAALAACGNQAETGTGSTVADPATGSASNKQWVDKATLDALPKDARSISGDDEVVVASGPEFVALAKDLASEDAGKRISAAKAISLTMEGAKGDYATALNQHIPRYLSTRTREFLGLFNPPNNMGKTELQAWAERLRRGPKSTGLTTGASEILRGMKSGCSDCTQSEMEVLDLFVGMATGQGGKGGKGGLK